MKKKLYRVEFSGSCYVLADDLDDAETLAIAFGRDGFGADVEAMEITLPIPRQHSLRWNNRRVINASGKTVAGVIAEADE